MTRGANPDRALLQRRFQQEPDGETALALAALAARAGDLREQQRFVLEAARLRRLDDRLSAAMEQAKLAVFALDEPEKPCRDLSINGEPMPLHDAPGVADFMAPKSTSLIIAGHAGAVRLGRIPAPEPAGRGVMGTFQGLKICGDTFELWRSGERAPPRLPDGVFCWDWIVDGDGILACGARLGWPWLGRCEPGGEIETLENATERLLDASAGERDFGDAPLGARRLIRRRGGLLVLPISGARWAGKILPLDRKGQLTSDEVVRIDSLGGTWKDALHGHWLATLDTSRQVSLFVLEAAPPDAPSGLRVRRLAQIEVPPGDEGARDVSLGEGILTLTLGESLAWTTIAELEDRAASSDSGEARIPLECTSGSSFRRLELARGDHVAGLTKVFGDASDPGVVAAVYERYPTFSGTVLEIRSLRNAEPP